MDNTVRIEQYDFIKGIAIFAVIIHHLIVFIDPNKTAIVQYSVGHAVPLFILVTISLYFNKFDINRNSKVNWKKIVYKIIPPFISSQVILFPVLLYYHIDLIKAVYGFGFGMGTYYILIYFQIILFSKLFYRILNGNFLIGTIVILIIHLLTEYLYQFFNVSQELYRLLFTRYLFLYPMAYLIIKRHLLNKYKYIIGIFAIFGLFLQYVTIENTNYFSLYPSYGFISQKFYTNFITLLIFVFLYKVANVVPYNKYFKTCGIKSYYIFLFQMVLFPWYLILANDIIKYHIMPLFS